EMVPAQLRTHTQELKQRTDVEQEKEARLANRFVIGRAEHLHGLEFEGVLLVGASDGEIPKISEQTIGAAAVFATQAAVDHLYLAITRARRQVGILYEMKPSTLLQDAVKQQRLKIIRG